MLSSVDSVLKLLTPRSVNGCLTMAHDEIKEVVDLVEEVNYKIIPVCNLHFTLKVFETSLWKMKRAGTTPEQKNFICGMSE